MIPKKIHYIWLGNKPKSKLTEVCINSWKRVMPDYEIIEWNENSIDIIKLCDSNRFLKRCFELKLWAFVSDYLRLYILYQEGGIYLDTDVETLKSFDNLLSNKVFMGVERGDYIGTAVIAAEKGNSLIKRLLNFYDAEIWQVDFINNPIIFKYLQKKEPNYFANCIIYPQNYFSPYTPGNQYQATVETKETYAIHWYTQNWNLSRKGYVFIQTKHIKNPLTKRIVMLRKNIGYFRKSYSNWRLIHVKRVEANKNHSNNCDR